MEQCTAEVGLLKKSQCTSTSVTHCANCERALCSKHAVAVLNAAGHKTGTFMCGECHAANKAIAAMDRPKAAPPKPAPAKPAAPPAHPAPAAGAAKAPAPAKKEEKKEDKPKENDDGSIEFTPTKK